MNIFSINSKKQNFWPTFPIFGQKLKRLPALLGTTFEFPTLSQNLEKKTNDLIPEKRPD